MPFPKALFKLGQEILLQVQSLNIPHEMSQISPFITVSIGVASARCTAGADIGRWIAEADRQLYSAKREGRNRIALKQFSPIDAVPANAA
ncbi:MAG: GGDEF domain-containing protein [Alphaproteobacteria bacterium]|nr:GGDEF domain-containing protein [Alphaproteobacteria bacterium]